jgi:hypothetical protein
MTTLFKRHYPIAALTTLFAIAVYAWFGLIGSHPLTPDAGYYLTAGKYISQGLIPYKDFPTAYSPGVFYIFSIFEPLNPQAGMLQQALTFAVHLINGALLYACLVLIIKDKSQSVYFSLFFVLLTFTLDGQAIVLEPFQNLFILTALYIALRTKTAYGALLAGLFIGLALMAKQSSMFSVPAIALIIAQPILSSYQRKDGPAQLSKELTTHAVLFCMGASLPFAAFCFIFDLDLRTTFSSVASFSGGASSYIAAKYTIGDVVTLFSKGDNGERLLVFFIVTAFLLLAIGSFSKNRAYIIGFALNLIPILFVRGYGHYIQLAALWGTILIAIFANLALAKLDHDLKPAFLFFMLAPLAPPLATSFISIYYMHQSLTGQIALAQSVDRHVERGERTVVIGTPWLYYLSTIKPPNLNLSFTMNAEKARHKLPLSDSVIVMPGHEATFKEALALSPAENFKKHASITYEKGTVAIYKRVTE